MLCSPSRVGVIQQTLHTCQDCRHIVRRTPSILQDIQTKLAVGIDIGVEHFGDKANSRGLVRISIGECESKSKRAVFKWCLGCPEQWKVSHKLTLTRQEARVTMLRRKWNSRGPKMTAFHTMILSGLGLPEIPMGASEVRRLKSRIRRRLAAVDYDISQHRSQAPATVSKRRLCRCITDALDLPLRASSGRQKLG